MDTDFINERMKLYNQDITTVGFSSYVLECLYWRGYTTVGKIAETPAKVLRNIGGIGEKYYKEIVEKMAELGIEIKETPPRKYDKSRKYPYPHNLIAAVQGMKPDELEIDYYGTDRLKGIAAALATLTDQEETMIVLRYKHYATFEEIGRYYGFTKERPRQIIKCALRKLRHPSRRTLFENGLEAYINDLVNSQAETKSKTLLFDEYMRGYNAGVADAERVSETCEAFPKYHIPPLSFDDLDLSVRSFNCLKRAGVNTIEDILAFDNPDDIMRIRNLGKRCTVEIANKLSLHGICNEAWGSFIAHSDKRSIEEYKNDILVIDAGEELSLGESTSELDNFSLDSAELDDDDFEFDIDAFFENLNISEED